MPVPNHLQAQIKALPLLPGVYQYFDKAEKILYVGKAKSLKKRVSSYFTKDHYSGRIALLVSKIERIEYIVTNTDLDALLLENTLIKKHKPMFNVELKDDKSYPSIVIKNERFPRVFPTRRLIKDGSAYFGPYASVGVMHSVLELIKNTNKIRTCNLNLSADNIAKNKYKVCLEYHLGNCKAPCVGKETEDEYNQTITNIKEILKGNNIGVSKQLHDEMQHYAENLNFERAQYVKQKIEHLERFKLKSTVVSPTISNVEVYSIATDNHSGYVNFMKVVNGAIIQGHTIQLKKNLDESPKDLLELGIAQIKALFNTHAKEILVPIAIDIELENVEIHVPQRGDKKKLVELSEKNVQAYIKDKTKQLELVDPERHTKRILEGMMKDLRLKELPVRIECFDNSNIQGAFPVSAMTVFVNAKPSKKDYRHFNIKTVEGPNDFASMEEVIYRRYKRVLDEGEAMPQLIIIDGGKGQLSAALTSLEKLNLVGKVPIIGIAKKLEELYFPNDSFPMYLDKRSETLRVIQHIRDEAHRFGITHHRNKRSKGTIKTELNDIPGIGTTIATKLLSHFKSVKQLKLATQAQIAEVIGNAKAQLVYDFFNKPA